MNPLFLQLFILLNVFLIGVLVPIAARHAYAHFKPPAREVEKPRQPSQAVHLPPEIKERLLQAAQVKFQTMLDHSADELQHNLRITTAELNKQLEKLGGEIANTEMQRYRADLEGLRAQTQAAIGGAQIEIVGHQTEIKAKLVEEMAIEKQRLIQQIDTKLADAVASFLTETLQHNVDLGAQSTYLAAMLEEHKAELIKGISDET